MFNELVILQILTFITLYYFINTFNILTLWYLGGIYLVLLGLWLLLDDGDIFRVDSWTQVMLGQGLMPTQYHKIANIMSDTELKNFLHGLKQSINNAVDSLPSHSDFIKHYCQYSTND